MSTSINGFKINVKNFDNLHKFFFKLREDIKKVQKEYIMKTVAEDCVEYVDQPSEKKTELNNTLLGGMLSQFDKNYREIYKTNYRNPRYDIGFSLTWFYYRKEFYAIVHADNPEIEKVFEDKKEVSEFMYYDHSDPPIDVSRKNWKKREKIWSRIVSSYIPINHGYELSITPKTIHHFDLLSDENVNSIVGLQPSYNSRKKITDENYYINEMMQLEKTKNKEETSLIDLSSVYFSARKKFKTDSSLAKKYKNPFKIKRRYSKKDFLKKY